MREDRLSGKRVGKGKGKTENNSYPGGRLKEEQGAKTELNHSKLCPKGPLRHHPERCWTKHQTLQGREFFIDFILAHTEHLQKMSFIV